MAFYDPLVSFLDPIFHPLIAWHPFFAIVLISLLVALISKLAYWKFTDQHVLKSVREQMKVLQADMKKYQNEPEKLLSLQTKMFDLSRQQMTQSFKPMLITMIPILVIFGWMSLNLAYEPIYPGDAITVDVMTKQTISYSFLNESETIVPVSGLATITLLGTNIEGIHNLTIRAQNQTVQVPLEVTTGLHYQNPVILSKGAITKTTVLLKNKDVLDLGFITLNWFWSYLVCVIGFSLALQKIMRLH
jgi:uncharacterized membrane protein (DUF106 family)